MEGGGADRGKIAVHPRCEVRLLDSCDVLLTTASVNLAGMSSDLINESLPLQVVGSNSGGAEPTLQRV